MDINNQPAPVVQPPVPLQWTWMAQRQETDGKGTSIWKFGFIAPDGADVRVTFHQVGDVAGQQAAKQQEQQAQAAQSMQMGMPPSPDPTAFAPAGQPQTDMTQDATFYVTFFSNRHPEFFMKWDTSLSHEDSMIVWITITHGVIDFVRKAAPGNVILDDLSNGKLKMVLRSVAMDVAAANPGYELEQTQKHHYRSFFQVKKTGTQSAFGNSVSGNKAIEGDTQAPAQATPITGGQAAVQAQTAQEQNPGGGQNPQPDASSPAPEGSQSPSQSTTQDPNQSTQNDQPAFPSSDEPIPIKKTAPVKRGMTVEIGRDYSIAVKDDQGYAVDRYRAKGPLDIMRWIHDKGYGASKMKMVDKEQPSGNRELAPEDQGQQPNTMFPNGNSVAQTEGVIVSGSTVLVKSKIEAGKAAEMNLIVNAQSVRLVDEGVEFVFATDKDMHFKKSLVELAAKRIGIPTACYCGEFAVPAGTCPTCSKV